jgi:formate hydrogenlyase subunit 3/multisubunit Na+/H+ antiporter MnhD subunit
MNRTDTLELPRIVATSSAPLVTLAAPPRRWLALLLVTLAIGATLAVIAGHSLAYRTETPVVVEVGDPDRLADIADRAAQLTGTDAGLITEPAR